MVQNFRFESQESTGGILNGIQKKQTPKFPQHFPEVEGVIVFPDLTSLFFVKNWLNVFFCGTWNPKHFF